MTSTNHDVTLESAHSTEPIMTLQEVTKEFPGADSPVLKGLDVAIYPGEFVAIVGPSGAGKSTLLNLLALLDRPSQGRYVVNGQDVSLLNETQRNNHRSRMFGLVFQASNMLLEESSLTNAMMGLRVRHIPPRLRRRLARNTLNELGLGHRLNTRAKLLSGGERQRCAIARAVATDPPVVLADEPTGNLDEENTARVVDILRSLHAHGKTVVVVTHDPEVAAAAQRRIELRDGRIVRDEVQARCGRSPHLDALRRPGDHVSRRKGMWLVGLQDDVVDAFAALTSRPLRTLVVVLSFMLGVGGLTSSVGLSETAGQQVQARFAQQESSQLRVSYRDSGPVLGKAKSDTETIATRTEGILASLEYVSAAGYQVLAAPSDVQVTRFFPWDGEMEAASTGLGILSPARARQAGVHFSPAGVGNVLQQMEAGGALGEAIVSREAARHLGMASEELTHQPRGYHLWVNGRRLNVVGMFDPGPELPLLTNTVLVAPEVMREVPGMVVEFVVDVEPGFARAVENAIPLALAPENPGLISVSLASDLGKLKSAVSGDLGLYVAVLSAVLLVLAGFSTGMAMYLSVLSRSSEIALRRAIGATKHSIARIFMTEGLLMGLCGGVCGAFAGMIATIAIAASHEWQAVLHPWQPAVGLFVGSVVGIASSAYPAWVASRQDPAGAMRA